jgi:hypothetical protein
MWYVLSTTLPEEAAWDFVNENGLNMVAINPIIALDSILQATPNYALELIRDYLNGKTPLHVSLS